MYDDDRPRIPHATRQKGEVKKDLALLSGEDDMYELPTISY